MFSAISDFELRVALGVAAIALVVTVGLTLQVLAMRLSGARSEARRRDLRARWRPVLLRAAAGEDELVDAQPLRRDEALEVLLLWNQLQDSLRGSAHEGLNRLASRMGAYVIARRWAASRRPPLQVLGVMTLGHFGRPVDWPLLLAALGDPRSYLSLAAARALLQIDARAAVAPVLDQYMARNDWSVARVGTLLRDAGGEAVGPALVERLLAGTPAQQLKLLPLAHLATDTYGGPVVQQVLERASDPGVLGLALQLVQGQVSLERARALLGHPDWEVRAQAALALGRVGQPIDRARLIALLSDREWWVRFRAAQALVTMPGIEVRTLRVLHAALEDRYARDMLTQVMAEREIGRVVLPKVPL